ncbi:MAG: hypothetical protein GX442_02945 [Candidatus Riflebacteria bacterium]|nr:hypothetical protein [Candidatus Riflebacteria bacterium]
MEDQKWAIVTVVVVCMVLGLLVLRSCTNAIVSDGGPADGQGPAQPGVAHRTGTGTGTGGPGGKAPPGGDGRPGTPGAGHGPGSAVAGRPGRSGPGGPAPLPMGSDEERQTTSSKAELEAMFREIQGFRKRVMEESREWGLKHVQDTSLASETREVYRLRMILPLHLGHKAFENKDYGEALRQYQKALEDPLSTPVTRYVTLDYAAEAARKNKDLDRYIELVTAQAGLVESEDLSALGLKKTEGMRKLFEDRGKLLRASKDLGILDSIIEERMRKEHATSDKSRARIAAAVRKDIEEAERAFYHDPEF